MKKMGQVKSCQATELMIYLKRDCSPALVSSCHVGMRTLCCQRFRFPKKLEVHIFLWNILIFTYSLNFIFNAMLNWQIILVVQFWPMDYHIKHLPQILSMSTISITNSTSNIWQIYLSIPDFSSNPYIQPRGQHFHLEISMHFKLNMSVSPRTSPFFITHSSSVPNLGEWHSHPSACESQKSLWTTPCSSTFISNLCGLISETS